EDAGIARGMAVLDVGSGAGDSALVAAELVGPEGRVVGVEINPANLTVACERARAAGLENVTFIEGDLRADLPLEGPFDALIGRLILIHLPDRVEVLRSLGRLLRPGGLIAFQETDTSVSYSDPPLPLADDIMRWIN